MGGGLMQLVAYGAQDIYLTGNPQITFFKVVYRRHTNFSMESIQQTFNGTIGASQSTVTATISRNGDLIHSMWLDVKFASQSAGLLAALRHSNWTNNTGHAFVKQCEIEIGGQLIDRHYSQWLDIWNELSDHDESEWIGLNKHTAKEAYLHKVRRGINQAQQLYIPLQFWFCRNPGLALPLIALQYHEVKLKLTTRGMFSLINSNHVTLATAVAPTSCNLWVDYIYLDTDERRRFAQVSHEYLIEQVQRVSGAMSTSKKLNFNHPVKELIWVVQGDTVATENNSALSTSTDIDATKNTTSALADKNDYFCYLATSSDDTEIIHGVTEYEPFATMKLQLNGHDRFAARNASYFRICQPQQAGHKVPTKHIYCYTFALKPEEHQPSGTCNFSRIDNANMIFTANNMTSKTLTVYAINYNVLRIMSGMGGLAYSN
jgi:hypothetical protein